MPKRARITALCAFAREHLEVAEDVATQLSIPNGGMLGGRIGCTPRLRMGPGFLDNLRGALVSEGFDNLPAAVAAREAAGA